MALAGASLLKQGAVLQPFCPGDKAVPQSSKGNQQSLTVRPLSLGVPFPTQLTPLSE